MRSRITALCIMACLAPCGRADTASGLVRVAGLKSALWDHPDTEWTRWIVVSMAPTRIYFESWTDAQRADFLRDFDPDHLDMWSGQAMNRGDFFRMRGVAVNSPMEYEYQELINPVYGHAAIFEGNGIARKEDGSIAGRYFRPGVSPPCACHMAPLWHEVVTQGMARQTGCSDSVFQDNIANPIYTWNQGFCDWCNRRFVAYMRERFSSAQLRELGFDAESFHIRRYLAQRRRQLGQDGARQASQFFQEEYAAGGTNARLLADPVVREYIRFQHISYLCYWVDAAETTKQVAVRQGGAVPACYGNIPRVSGIRTFPTIMASQVDIVWSEESTDMQPCFRDDRQAWSALLYKVGRAASYHDKPVISVQYQGGHKSIYHEPGAKRYPTALACSEAVANGGVLCQTWSATEFNHLAEKPGWDDVFRQTHRRHAAFAGRHRALFLDRRPVADVALVYSFPSTFWREFQSLRVAGLHKDVFSAAARLLEDNHIPYEVLLLGHPDVFDDTFFLERLDGYRTIVLPHVDCLSRVHEERLAAWVRQGGDLVLLGRTGGYDEELAPRGAAAFEDVVREAGQGQVIALDQEATLALTYGRDILPTAQVAAETWSYTFEEPVGRWYAEAFDDSTWEVGPAPFGDRTIRGTACRTPWDTSDIWLRREFRLAGKPDDPVLYLQHWWDVEVYINGVPAAVGNGRGQSFEPYQYLALTDQGAALRRGKNTIAVHCRENREHPTYGKFIDVGIRDRASGDEVVAAVAAAGGDLLQTDLPDTVWVNVWRHGGGPMTSVQMVNYDMDIEADRMRPVDDFRVRLRKQGTQTYRQAYWFHNGFDGGDIGEPETLAVRDDGEAWEVTVGRLTLLGVLVFASEDELAARTAAATVRKYRERLGIALRCAGAGTVEAGLMDRADGLLGRVQGATAGPDCGRLTPQLQAMAVRLEAALEQTTASVQTQQEASARALLAAPAVYRFDFGNETAPQGWTVVTPQSLYSPQTGYGWLEEGPLTVVDHGLPDAVHGDFIRNIGPDAHYDVAEPETFTGRFRVDCPSGRYRVTVVTGSYGVLPLRGTANEGRVATTFVKANGALQTVGDRLCPGRFQNRAFVVDVSQDGLVLEFYGRNIGPLYANTIQWLVNAVLLQRLDQPPTPAAAAYLDQSEQCRATAIRQWRIRAPRADTDGRALAGFPDAPSAPAAAAAWQDAAGGSAWRSWRLNGNGFPLVPLHEMASDIHRVIGYARTCVHSPAVQEAVVHGSCSQLGRVYVNGEEVCRDELAAGVLPEEFWAPVRLRQGWNEIVVESGNYWGTDWSFWLGLSSPTGEPLADLLVDENQR